MTVKRESEREGENIFTTLEKHQLVCQWLKSFFHYKFVGAIDLALTTGCSERPEEDLSCQDLEQQNEEVVVRRLESLTTSS